METFSDHDIPIKSPHVAWQLVDGEAVILHITGEMLRGLNSVGSQIWQLIDGSRTLAAIAREVAVEFSCGEEEMLEDVKHFFNELIQKNMIVI